MSHKIGKSQMAKLLLHAKFEVSAVKIAQDMDFAALGPS